MKNVVDITLKLIQEMGPVSLGDIKAKLNPEIFGEILNIDAVVYNDLLTDGRLIYIDNRWDLKDTFTMKEIIKEQYRAIGNYEDIDTIVEPDDIEEEESEVLIIDDDEVPGIEISRIDELDDVSTYDELDDEN